MPDDAPLARKPDADRSRRDILSVARLEFVRHGLAGARIDAIADRMQTTKRMIYYYFGSKEGLYTEVLRQAYADIRDAEAELPLERLAPPEAIRALVEFSFDYADANSDFVRLLAIENVHQAEYLRRLPAIRTVNAGIIHRLGDILARGREDGSFARDSRAEDVHMMINALCFYRVSNRHTFGTLFGCDLSAPAERARHKAMVVDAVTGYLRTTGP